MINNNPKYKFVNVIGCGFAGIETALFLAGHGVKVHAFNVFNDKSWNDKEIYSSNHFDENEEKFNLLLEKELAFLGSPIAREWERLKNANQNLTEEQLLKYGLEMVKDNENIEFFDATICEINPSEINVIATGNNTNKNMFGFLINQFGSMKCQSNLSTFPVLSNVDESLLINNPLKEDEYLLPLLREEYLIFINTVVDEINKQHKFCNQPFVQNTIEFLVEKGIDCLKNYAMKPIFVEGMAIKPYATVRLVKQKTGYELQNFATFFDKSVQTRIFRSLICFENAIIERKAYITEGSFLNAQFVINEYGQSISEENLFFAGGLLGLSGWRQCVASGLMTGANVLKILKGQRFETFSSQTAMGKLKDALCPKEKTSLPQFSRLLKKSINEYKDKTIEKLFELSINRLKKFKEGYLNGKHV